MNDAVERLVRIETKLDHILGQLLDHEGRVNSLHNISLSLSSRGSMIVLRGYRVHLHRLPQCPHPRPRRA